MSNKSTIPDGLTDEQRKRALDILVERALDKKRKIKRAETLHPIVELNVRMKAYTEQFPYTLEFLILQTLQDFKKDIIVRQSGKLVKSEAVAQLHDGTPIYVDPMIIREDFKGGLPEIFTLKEPLTKLGE